MNDLILRFFRYSQLGSILDFLEVYLVFRLSLITRIVNFIQEMDRYGLRAILNDLYSIIFSMCDYAHIFK